MTDDIIGFSIKAGAAQKTNQMTKLLVSVNLASPQNVTRGRALVKICCDFYDILQSSMLADA